MPKADKRKGAAPALYALFDSEGEHADTFYTRAEAKGCAWGPRFREGFTIVRYKRTIVRRYGRPTPS